MKTRLILPLLLLTAAADPLALARRQSDEAARRAEAYVRAAAAAKSAAERARNQAEALAAGIDRVEADISVAEGRIATVEQLQARQRTRLAARQAPLVRLTAALQTMARRPAALALAQPGSLDDLVRVRAVLAATLPVVAARTAALRQEVEAGEALRAEAARARAALADSRGALHNRRIALARLEEAERGRALVLGGAARAQSDRALVLGEEARALSAAMATDAAEARLGRALAALPAPLPRPTTGAPPLAPTPPYRLPVAGELLVGTGEISDAGIHARGLTLAPAPGAAVVAPRAGRVAFAGRFRGYGEVVIIDHGGGWTSTITGLAALRVARDARVAAGDPVGRAPAARPRIGVELRHDGAPVPLTRYIL